MPYVLPESEKSGSAGRTDHLSEGKWDQECISLCSLHTAPAGQKFGRFSGEDVYTTKESERLLRLPMFYNLDMKDVAYVTDRI